MFPNAQNAPDVFSLRIILRVNARMHPKIWARNMTRKYAQMHQICNIARPAGRPEFPAGFLIFLFFSKMA